MSEIKINEVDVQRLNLKEDEVLIVKIKADEVSQQDLEALGSHFKKILKTTKVVVLSVGSNDNIDLTIAKVPEYPEINYCSDCSCGKKEAALKK